MLISEMEVQKKESSSDAPPVLPHPFHDKKSPSQPGDNQ
jgi:hypothetical protein